MKTRKILAAAMAGLCAVSTMGVSAFATVVDEKIETSGAKSYKVSAGFQAPTINVTVPESVLGVINPYKINVEIEGETFEAEGVASPKYTITNNSDEIGINVKATYSAEGLDGLVDAADKATDPTKNTEKKKYAYVTLNAESPLDVTKTDTTASTADVKLEFSADATKPEKTDVLMRLNVAATGATDNAGKFWIGGDVIEEPAEKWTTSDKLSINVVLDINPFNTGATGGPGGFTSTVAKTDIGVGASGIVIGALTANDTFAATVDGQTAALGEKLTFTGYNTYTVTSSDPTVLAIGTAANAGKINYPGTPKNGTTTLTFTLTPDAGGSDVTLKLDVTVSNV